MNLFELTLATTPVESWRAHQVIIFDWYDGPREGFCELAYPRICFYFKLLAEACESYERGDALFRISALPLDTISQTVSLLATLGDPTKPVWIPRWLFPSPAAEAEADAAIDRLLSHRQPSSLIIQTANMTHFLGCWVGVRLNEQGLDQ
jgi:hypothetical protein